MHWLLHCAVDSPAEGYRDEDLSWRLVKSTLLFASHSVTFRMTVWSCVYYSFVFRSSFCILYMWTPLFAFDWWAEKLTASQISPMYNVFVLWSTRSVLTLLIFSSGWHPAVPLMKWLLTNQWKPVKWLSERSVLNQSINQSRLPY